MPKNVKGTKKLKNGTSKYTLCFVPLSENGTNKYTLYFVPLSPCPLVPLSPCQRYLVLCFLVPLSPCPLVPLSPCLERQRVMPKSVKGTKNLENGPNKCTLSVKKMNTNAKEFQLVPLSPCPLVPLSPCPLVPLSPCLERQRVMPMSVKGTKNLENGTNKCTLSVKKKNTNAKEFQRDLNFREWFHICFCL